MRRFYFLITATAVSFLIYSCNNSANNTFRTESSGKDKIVQKEDGTIVLKIEQAACYNNEKNPSSNTAEWNIVISKPGRYKVWLSSATTDTTDLAYNNSVTINLQDERIDARPRKDKVIYNSGDVKYPYFRADSYMGTFYIQEPGEYSVQIISEKVIAASENKLASADTEHTKVMSVFLTPITQ